jgi:CelD/BcsL family acetyltransferase involved in cellulose biosynthesis
MHDNIDLRILRDTAALEAIEPQWRALWDSDPLATPFQTPEWLLPWWRHFGQPELTAVAIHRDGKLTGLLPFYIYREPGSGQRQLLLIGAGTSDYLDGVFAPECTPNDILRAIDFLRSSVSWDLASLTQLRTGSRLLQALTSHAGRFPTESCWHMPAVPASELPATIRRNVTQRRNRARRTGSLEYTLARASTCVTDFEFLVRLHNERWQTRGQGGIFHDPRVLAWHREAVPLLASRNLLRLFSLRHNGETIAAMYCLADSPLRATRSLYVYIPAFSPRFAKLSPGTLLLAHAVDQSAAEGIQTIDLLRGHEGYKQLWHMEPAPTFGCEVPRHLPSASPALEEAA